MSPPARGVRGGGGQGEAFGRRERKADASPEPAPEIDLLRDLPDVRDGLTRPERAVLVALHEAQREFPGRHVPTALLYGRVVEREGMSVEEFQRILARLAGGYPRAPYAFERSRRR